jgi:hypothetical protein
VGLDMDLCRCRQILGLRSKWFMVDIHHGDSDGTDGDWWRLWWVRRSWLPGDQVVVGLRSSRRNEVVRKVWVNKYVNY